jgi:hypothetical protein
MPGSHPPVTLRLEPHMLPVVRAAFDDALAELRPQLIRVGQTGYVQATTTAHSPRSDRLRTRTVAPYAALVAYEAELLKVRDNLQVLEGHYRRTEVENAALWGRL